MAVNLSPIWGAGAQLLDNSGNVLSGGKIYTYAAGTTTQVTTYTSNSGITANSNPIVLNSAGRVPYEIWLTDGQNYKFVLKDSNDVLIGTWDNLSGINSNFISYTNQQEIQTATAGQTVFNLTTMQYIVATNSLSVFVDGVNQYGPGAQYAYEETSPTVVTFASGLHVGAEVKFTSSQIQNSGIGDASQITYTYPAVSAVTESVEDRLAQYVSVKDFGAIGDGVANDTAAFQNAATHVGQYGMVAVPYGTYNLTSDVTDEVNWIINSKTTFTGTGKLTWHSFKFGHGSTNYSGTYAGAPVEWLESQFQTLTTRSTAGSTDGLIAESGAGLIGITGASRTSDTIYGAGAMSCIGIAAFAVNDNTSVEQYAYGYYVDGYRAAGAGWTTCFESDIINMGTTSSITPHNFGTTTGTPNMWIASGGGVVGANDASCAIAVINNGAKFERGLVFGSNALTSSGGLGEAISFYTGHYMQWYNSTGVQTSAIQGTITTGAITKQQFSDSGVDFTNAAGTPIFRISNFNATSVVNHLEAVGGTTGANVNLNAIGTDTNIGITLQCKNAGKVGITTTQTQTNVGAAGGASSLPATPLGYIKILLNGSDVLVPYYNP